MLLANVIFPALLYPFLCVLGAPLLIPVILAFEALILSHFNPASSKTTVILACLCANGASAFIGFVTTLMFPVGVFPAMHNPQEGGFHFIVWASIPLLCGLSIAIEGFVYWLFKRKGCLARVMIPTIYGNVLGYLLISLFMMNVFKN